jgi:DNA-binding NarL/FixJ family response regulator
MVKRALAVIVVRSRPLLKGVHTLLTSIPGIEIASEADDVTSVLDLVNERHPDLVLFDAVLLDNQLWKTLREIKVQWPQIRCIVLTDEDGQGQRARAVQADAVLQKGMPAAAFVRVIEDLLPERG